MAVTINASTSTGLVQSADTSGEIELQSNGTTALKVNTNEGIQILNCLGVGNATPSTSGAGITFPATQSASTDANTLDDYEEGSWTPTLTTDGTATTPAYTSQNGRYVKIGSRVFIEAYLQWSSTSGGSGSVLIAGLPFTASGYSPDSRGFSYIFGWNGITFTGVLASVITASGTSAPLYSNNNGSIASLPLTSCSSGGALRFVFDYSV